MGWMFPAREFRDKRLLVDRKNQTLTGIMTGNARALVCKHALATDHSGEFCELLHGPVANASLIRSAVDAMYDQYGQGGLFIAHMPAGGVWWFRSEIEPVFITYEQGAVEFMRASSHGAICTQRKWVRYHLAMSSHVHDLQTASNAAPFIEGRIRKLLSAGGTHWIWKGSMIFTAAPLLMFHKQTCSVACEVLIRTRNSMQMWICTTSWAWPRKQQMMRSAALFGKYR